MHISKLTQYYNPRYVFFFEPHDVRQPAPLFALGWDRVTNKNYRQVTRRWKDHRFFLRYTISGRGRLKIGSKEYELTPGQAFLIKTPNDISFYLPEDSSHWEFIYIGFSESEERYYSSLITSEPGIVHAFDKHDPIIRSLYYIYSQAKLDQITDACTTAHLAHHFMMLLLQRFNTKNPESDYSELQISAAIRHMKENMLSADLDSMALTLKVTKYHLIRLFKQHTGMTPIEYLTAIRIKEAMRLLQETDLTLDKIAEEIGYSHPSYLCRVFKKQFGLTPNELRQELGDTGVRGF